MLLGKNSWKTRKVCPFMGRADCQGWLSQLGAVLSNSCGNRGLALAYMQQIYREIGPKTVAEAIADTAQIHWGRGLKTMEASIVVASAAGPEKVVCSDVQLILGQNRQN